MKSGEFAAGESFQLKTRLKNKGTIEESEVNWKQLTDSQL